MNKIRLISIFSMFILLSYSFQSIGQNWATLDAVVYNNKTEKYYFFFGKYYAIKERGKNIDGLPLKITDDWEGFPKSWSGGNVDAVCYSSDTETYHFFRGDEYSSKPQGEKMKAPVKIKDSGFKGIPWPGLDAAVYNTMTNTYYFFYGEEYVSKKKGEPVDPTKKSIKADWFKNMPGKFPIRDVAYSSENEAYYFYWDDVYATKKQGENFGSGFPKAYTSENSGFEWVDRAENNFVGLSNEGGYVAYFKVSWESGGKKDSWSSGDVAITYSHRLKLPKDAINIRISAYEYKFINDAVKIFEDSPQKPPNTWYKIYGTTLDPKYKKEKKAPIGLQDVSDFFTKDVVDGIESAGDYISRNMNAATKEILKSKAAEDAKRLKVFIDQFSADAVDAIKDQATIESLYRVSKQKSGAVAKDAMLGLARHPAFTKTFELASSFKSFSIGFSAGSSAVIGIEGSFGYALEIPELKTVKGYAGFDPSVGVQGGNSLGCQFAIWTSPPSNLDGTSAAINVEIGNGIGVSVSIVYNVNTNSSGDPFTFAGVVVTPSIGAGIGASVGMGYSWVY